MIKPEDIKPHSLDPMLNQDIFVSMCGVLASKYIAGYHNEPITIGYLDRTDPDDHLAFRRTTAHFNQDAPECKVSDSNYTAFAKDISGMIARYSNYSGRIVVTLRFMPERPTLIFEDQTIPTAIEFGSSAFDGGLTGPRGAPKTAKGRTDWMRFEKRQRLYDPIIDSEYISSEICRSVIERTNYRGPVLWVLPNRLFPPEFKTYCCGITQPNDLPIVYNHSITSEIENIAHDVAQSMESICYAGNLTINFTKHKPIIKKNIRFGELDIGILLGIPFPNDPLIISAREILGYLE